MARFRYKHIQSTVEDKVPSGLLDGEIAVNRFKGKEKLFLKNASGDVVSFSSDSQIDGKLANKLNVSDFNTYSGAVDTTINSKAAQSDLNALSGTVTAHTASTNIHLTSAEKTNLDSLTGTVGTMAYQDVDNYYAKNETSGKTEISTALGTKVNSATYTAHTADTSAHFSGNEKENLDSLATNIAAISGITAEKVTSWDNASSDSHTHSNKSKLDAITGDVGTMAYQNASSYSSATEVNTALSGKSDTGHTHDDRYYTESELTGSSTTVVVAKAASATTAASAAVANSVALSNVTGADDLKAIEALEGTSGLLKKTAANTWSLDTNSYSTTAVTVTGATYNTTNKTIDLKNADGTVVSTVDATDFIKDGMISGVTLETKSGTTYLVISWNTDAGIETTELNIGDLFEADNYYTKNELTGSSTTVVVAKASSASTAASAGSVALSNVTGADDLKAIEALAGTSGILKKTAANTWSLDTTSYSSATEVNTALGNKLDKSDFNTYSGAVDTAINSKASQSTVDALNATVTAHTANTNIHLTSTEKSNLDSLTGAVGTMAYENKNSYSSATEVNSALNEKQDVITAGSGITITDNEISVDDTVALSSDVDDLIKQSETISAALNYLNDNKLGLSAYTPTDKLIHDTLARRTRIDFTSKGLEWFKTTLKAAVASQSLETYGLKVGDYVSVTHDGKTYQYVIAGLNTMNGPYSPYRLNTNHVGIIVNTNDTHAWNVSGNTYQSTNTYSTGGTWTTGASAAGYANCDLHYYLTTTVLPNVEYDFGSDNIKSHYKLYSNAVNTSGYNRFGSAGGCSSGWAWYANQKICALSEVQVYGSTVWSSSGYDTGEACRQLDVFRVYNMNEIFGWNYPWLRDVASASSACFVCASGLAHYATASSTYCVAALILFA